MIDLMSENQIDAADSRGSPNKPLSRAELFEKFWRCVGDTSADKNQVEQIFIEFQKAGSVSAIVRQIDLLTV